MEWLADIISNLPIDAISEMVSRLIMWWTSFVADVPSDELPMKAYLGFSVIVLVLWLFIVRVLPKPLGGMSWLAVFAILLTPGLAADSSEIAPASIGVVYGLLMQKPGLMLRSLLPILVVFSAGMFLGFIWQLIRNTIDSNLERTRRQAMQDEKKSVQLAAANYGELVQGNSVKKRRPKLMRSKKKSTKASVEDNSKNHPMKSLAHKKQISDKQTVDN